MAPSRNGNKSNPLWSLFTSVKLTLGLLIVLAVTSIFGTVIPQQDGAMELAEQLSPGLMSFLSSLQLFDMYHSVWFRVIIGTLALNLIICSLDRFPASWKRFQAAPKLDRSKPFDNLPSHRNFSAAARFDEVLSLTAGILKQKYKRVHQKETDNEAVLYAEKGRFSHLGVYLVHLSILIILIGSIVGSLFGFEAYVNIPEGESTNKVRLRKSQVARALPFDVRLDRFTVEFYDNGAPKEYRSDLVFVEGGKTALQGSLLVNHPITFGGITFYQSSYHPIASDKVRIKLSTEGSNPNPPALEVSRGDTLELPGKEGHFEIVEVAADFRGLGPAALVSVHPLEGDEKEFWIFQNMAMIRKRFPPAMLRSPSLDPSAFKPYTFSLEGVEMKYATGLQVSRDPGVPLVWTGFFLIMIGLFVTFFTSHRSIWIQVARTKRGVNVRVAGRANKNPVGLERELDQLASRLKGKLEKKDPV
jgi:cytochrome c biogenesis protein